MNEEAALAHRSSLVDMLSDLASEIDGVVDFGMTVCATKEDRIAGRHTYIIQQCEKIHRVVDSILSVMNEDRSPNLELSGTDQLLSAFLSLEHFRSLSSDCFRSTADALRAGWESIHRVIPALAEKLDLLDPSWYSPIRERQDTYRTHLEHIGSSLQKHSSA